MEQEVNLHIILQQPTAGVDFAIQKGKGNNYETIQKQRSAGRDLLFKFSVKVKTVNNAVPVFTGSAVQGNPTDRFIYIGIGAFAGQKESNWSRRLKIPLKGITDEMMAQLLSDPELVLITTIPGTGKDGGPNCGTVKPFNGWKVAGSYS